jgi:MFS family permease
MTFCVDVITADSSKLKNRGLAYAFTSSPYIITAFAGPKAAEDFLAHVNWRWGFGCFAIILPVVAAPLYIMLKVNLRKAQQQGILVREKSGRSVLQSIWHYIVEFDGGFSLETCPLKASLTCCPASPWSLPLLCRPHRVPSPVYSCHRGP